MVRPLTRLLAPCGAPAMEPGVTGGNVMAESAEVMAVGAGPAGVVAARDLAAAGRSVLVLDARDRVGGRVVYEAGGWRKVKAGS